MGENITAADFPKCSYSDQLQILPEFHIYNKNE